jgi:hypothetical protein
MNSAAESHDVPGASCASSRHFDRSIGMRESHRDMRLKSGLLSRRHARCKSADQPPRVAIRLPSGFQLPGSAHVSAAVCLLPSCPENVACDSRALCTAHRTPPASRPS